MFDLHVFLVSFHLSRIQAHIVCVYSVKSEVDRWADALRSYRSAVLFTLVAEPGELPVTLLCLSDINVYIF